MLDADHEEWQRRLPEGYHDIVKHPEHGAECRKCGKVGTMEVIKSNPCPPFKPKCIDPTSGHNVPSPPKEKADDLGAMLDRALKNDDHNAAWEIINKMEADHAQQSLQDQVLAVELMEQELELLDAMEQLEQIERLEAEEAELEKAMILSKQPLEKSDEPTATRPPATQCASPTAPPMVGKTVVAKPPTCFLAVLSPLKW